MQGEWAAGGVRWRPIKHDKTLTRDVQRWLDGFEPAEMSEEAAAYMYLLECLDEMTSAQTRDQDRNRRRSFRAFCEIPRPRIAGSRRRARFLESRESCDTPNDAKYT